MHSIKIHQICLCFFLFSIIVSPPDLAKAVGLTGVVKDQKGNVVKNAIITLFRQGAEAGQSLPELPRATLTQKDIQFAPFVLPVTTGTLIKFPNKDKVKHHVYSFSKIKRFELRLYGGDEEKDVLFDKKGVVAVGCNIHDSMLAYIYITDSRLFGKTDTTGSVTIEGLEAGNYQAFVWHPRLKGKKETYQQDITIASDGSSNLSFEIPLKRDLNRKNKKNC